MNRIRQTVFTGKTMCRYSALSAARKPVLKSV